MHPRLALQASALAIAVALAFAGLAVAQDQDPPPVPVGPGMAGCGIMVDPDFTGSGRMMGMMTNPGHPLGGSGCDAVTNPMHAVMHAALAEGLGLTRAELDSRLAAGATPAQIAEDLGLSREAFLAVLTEARAAAWASLDEANVPPPARTGMGAMHARRPGPHRWAMPGGCPCQDN
jgi:hypothetical protein